MSNLFITNNANIASGAGRKTILDNNLLLSSEITTNRDLLRVDPNTNNIAIFKNTTATATLDVNGTMSISNSLTVQNTKLIVDNLGRIGINAIPSTDLTIQGDVFFEGLLTVMGPLFTGTTTALEVLDSKITLNKNGSTATASGGGLTIQRTSDNAQLIWDEVRQNFRAGTISYTTSIIKVGGNIDGADISIGSNDNFTLTIKTNNTTRVSVGTTGNVALTGDLSIPTGDMLIQGTSVKNGRLPPGTIISFIPGTFGDTTNGSFTVRLGTANTAAATNAWLAANGYPHWKVCDGQSYTEAQSLLYNALGPGANIFNTFLFNTSVAAGGKTFGGGSKFTPNLTDARFLAGSTIAGRTTDITTDTPGTNIFDHTHSLDTRLSSTTLAHSHPTNTCVALSAETVSLNTYATDVAFSNPGTTSDTYTCASHNHNLGDHSHSDGDLKALFLISSGSGQNKAYIRPYNSGRVSFATQMNTYENPYSENWGHSEGTNIDGSSAGMSCGTTSCNGSSTTSHWHDINHAHSQSHTHGMPAAVSHTHSAGVHSHTYNACAIPTSQFSHSHNISTNTINENRPKYMTNFFLVKII